MKIFKRAFSAATASVMAASMCAFDIGSLGPVNAAGLSAVDLVEDMGQGWNLGNSFDSSNTWKATYSSEPLTPTDIETAWGNPVTTEAMIKEIKKSGFKTVRIPITWYQMIDSSGKPNAEWLARINEVVDYCINNDMYAIINTHHDEFEWVNSADSATVTKFKNLWTNIANYFADYDQHLVFEGMNEQDVSNSVMMTLNQAFVDAVRATGGNNTNRLLLVEAAQNNTDNALSSEFSAPTDSSKMVAVSVHYYEPTAFCVSQDPSNQWWYQSSWGTAADVTKAENDLDKLEAKFIKNGIPVIIGEYGVVNKALAKKDDASMKKFLKEVATYALAKDGMCPVVWDMSVQGDVGTDDEGDMYYFNRNTLSWYDEDIKNIFLEAAAGSSSVDTSKTDRVTFTSDQIGAVDEKTGKKYLQVDLKPYKEYGVNVSSAIVKFKVTASGSTEANGNIAASFNVNTDGGDLKYSNIDTSIGINDTTVTIDLTPETFNTAWDDAGAVTETSSGKIDMDYIKFENWWTWANNGDAAVELESVTVIFDGYIASDNTEPIVTTTTQEQPAPTTTTTTATTPPSDTKGDVVGNAYIMGMLGADACWSIDEVNALSSTAAITGDGQYTVEWVPENGGTDTLQFLAVQINAAGTADTFTTDSFPNLAITVDEVWIDGVKLADYTTSEKAVNTRYYDGDNPGVSRIYLHDDWSTKVADVAGKTNVTESVKVVFTISGTISEDEGVAGDANCDGKVTLADAVAVLQSIANKDKYGLSEQGKTNADVDGVPGITANDALIIQQFDAKLVTELPVAAK